MKKCGNFWKNGRFSRRIWPDWGNTAWADMAELGSIGLKTTFEQYHINFSNSDFSLDIASISAKFLGYVLHSPPERRKSQNFDLGLGYIFMLCRNFGKIFFHYYLRFMSQKLNKNLHKKNETLFPREERYQGIP